jgi:transcriptional regulator with GAF, ATPase, and Fis domain
VNCAAIVESLAESELFGHERGAFTGAAAAKAGLFEAADTGTLFLDEVGELPLKIQATLLRTLETGIVTRVGGTQSKKVDVRIVAATNRDLASESKVGRFRADLYFRLSGIVLRLPSLRQRTADILPLAEWFLEQAATHHGVPRAELDEPAKAMLLRYAWPGNVRELRRAMERSSVLANGGPISPVLSLGPEDDPDASVASGGLAGTESHPDGASDGYGLAGGDSDPAVAKAELVRALEQTGWNQSRAAALIGVSRNTLMKRMSKYGLKRPRG